MAKRYPKAEVYECDVWDTFNRRPGKEWRWRIKGANGKIVCQGESHPTKAKAKRAVQTVVDCCSHINVHDIDEIS